MISGKTSGTRVGEARFDGAALFFGQSIDADTPRLNIGRNFSELVLILLRPGRHSLKDFSRIGTHTFIITSLSPSCHANDGPARHLQECSRQPIGIWFL